MNNRFYEEFDTEKIYLKLISPSKPRTVKASEFFKQVDLLNPLQRKMAQVLKNECVKGCIK